MANLLRIKDIAESKGISVRELAERVGIKENQVHVMCRTNSTKIDTLEKIAQALGVSVSLFFDDTLTSIRIEGDNNQYNSNGAHGNVNGDCAVLTERVKHLEALLAEKERLISVLMNK